MPAGQFDPGDRELPSSFAGSPIVAAWPAPVSRLDVTAFLIEAAGELEPVDLNLFGLAIPRKLTRVSGKDRLGVLDVPQLEQNAPNPFNSQTVLAYFLPEAGPVRLEVFSLLGQRVAVLHQGPQSAGHHRLYWNGLDAAGRSSASGVYLYRLETDFGVLTRKLMLLR